MSKRSQSRRVAKAASRTYTLRAAPNWPLAALAAVGQLLPGYLTWTAFAGSAPTGCSAGGGCDVVLASRWSTLLGLPTSLWGFFGYAALAGIAFIRRADTHWSYAWTVAFFGLCYSVYLTLVSLTILGSTCPHL